MGTSTTATVLAPSEFSSESYALRPEGSRIPAKARLGGYTAAVFDEKQLLRGLIQGTLD
jgi:hypothetical protein